MSRILEWLDRLLAGTAGPRHARYGGGYTHFRTRPASSLDGAYFRADVDVTWPRGEPSSKTRASAETSIRQVIQGAARRYSVLNVGEASTAVDLALEHALPDVPGYPLNATCHLTSEPESEEYAKRHEELERDAMLERAKREARVDELAFFADRVLPYPNLARVWWLRDDPSRIMELADNATVFENTARVFTAAPGAASEDPIPGLLRSFLTGLGPQHRDLLLRQLREIFLGYERPDLADLLNALLEPAPWSTSPSPNGHPRPGTGSGG